uniref:putative inorganic carbon transporter subunit DabA n=1 Tax=Acidocella sp. C78 TaxID=1671486 RepID=UPI00191BC9FD
MNVDLARPTFAASGATETLDAQIAAAARAVPALWPLDGAIAVNPLAAFEDHPFETAIRAGARQYGARAALKLDLWRSLAQQGQPPRDAVRDVAIDRLGGLDAAFHSLGPDVTPLDCLMARLFDLPPSPPVPAPADPAAMLVARWCA